MAVAGLTTPSMAERHERAARSVKASISQEMSTSSGSRVRRLGHDGDVVEPVGPTPGLADPDLDLSHVAYPVAPARWKRTVWSRGRSGPNQVPGAP